jgi:hypothetical protein
MKKLTSGAYLGFLVAVPLACVNAVDTDATDLSTNLDACPAQYVVKAYKAGDRVQNQGNAYECKAYPFSGWCGLGGAYEPGVGFAWQDAWTKIGACGGTGTGGSGGTGTGGTGTSSGGSTASGGTTSSGGSSTGGSGGSGGSSGTSCTAWRAGTAYVTGNVVTFNGKNYIAEHDNPGYDPTISTWFWDPYSGSCSGTGTGSGGTGGTGGSSTGSGGSGGGPTGNPKLEVRAGSVAAEYLPWLRQAANTCAFLDAAHLAAQIDQESRWDPRAVSWLGAQGISQFLPGTWAAFGVDANGNGRADPFEPADAIVSQGKYMCYLVGQFGSDLTWTTLLWAYNAGPEATKAAGGRAPTQEASDYAHLILTQLLPKYKP